MRFQSIIRTPKPPERDTDPPTWLWAIAAGWLLALAVMLCRLTPAVSSAWICRG